MRNLLLQRAPKKRQMLKRIQEIRLRLNIKWPHAHMLLLLREAGDRDKLLAGLTEALHWPLPTLLSGCCLRVILETLGWLFEFSDQESIPEIREDLKTESAFIFLDISRHDYLLWQMWLGWVLKKTINIFFFTILRNNPTLSLNKNISMLVYSNPHTALFCITTLALVLSLLELCRSHLLGNRCNELWRFLTNMAILSPKMGILITILYIILYSSGGTVV